jgi:general secretion pathway protein A
MYAAFFGLQHEPFSIAPDPRYLFMSERHREALAHLLYGVKGGGGFVLLSGEIGAGKTTVCRCFLEQVPKRCNVAYIFNPKLTVEELLQTICQEFHIPVGEAGGPVPSLKAHVDALNAYLLRTHAVGQNNVLIIDEAQNLSPEVLEQLRLLTNLETSERKLLQIMLIGQPELRAMLARPELEQLAQRVIARFHLEALSREETEAYIRHRLGVAGLSGPVPFDRRAIERIQQLSRGVPRRINLLCDRALLGAYATGKSTVTRDIVDKAAAEVFDRRSAAAPPHAQGHTPAVAPLLASTGARAGMAALLVVALAGVLALGWDARQRGASVASAAGAASGAASGASATAASATTAALRTGASAPGAKLPLAAAVPLSASAAAAAWPAADVWLSERDGLRALAQAWRAGEGTAPGVPCSADAEHTLQCYRGTGTLALLRQLDRPALLALREADGSTAWAVLSKLDGAAATLLLPAGPRRVDLGALAGRWRGEFTTLFREPPEYPSAGDEPRAVSPWLTAQLDKVAPVAMPMPLKSRLAAFQLAQGLQPDGRPGPMTYMQLNRALGVDEPRLVVTR